MNHQVQWVLIQNTSTNGGTSAFSSDSFVGELTVNHSVPQITGVSSPSADGWYKEGDTITIELEIFRSSERIRATNICTCGSGWRSQTQSTPVVVVPQR